MNCLFNFPSLVISFIMLPLLLLLFKTNIDNCVFATIPTSSSSTEGEWSLESNSLDQVYYLSFILPSHFEILGSQCNLFSRHFCVMGYGTHNRRNRIPSPDDRDDFHELISTSFASMNWFSFKSEDAHSMGCCMYQVNTYMRLGRGFGYSPEDYYERVANLGTTFDRHDLVFIKARWEPTICMNVISQVGYGFGPFSVVTGQPLNESYTLPPLGYGEEVFVFEGNQLEHKLNFDWFLHNAICKEQPRFCRTDQETDYENDEEEKIKTRKAIRSRRKRYSYDFQKLKVGW